MGSELEDVEDLSSWNGEGEAPPPEDDASAEFLRKGNSDFRNARFKEAIMCYTKALQGSSVDHALLYSNRCAAYCRLSKLLRTIPARVSEESAIYELDPMSLGQLALRDAEKVVKLRSQDPKAYLCKATAQTLLEQYEAAVEVYLSGLEIDPTNKTLQDGLREVKTLMEGAEHSDNKRRKLERSDELDCTLCLKLLHQPITTPCGHSFCRQCLLQALDHGNKCPICRTVIFVSPKTYPVSVTLNNLIQRNFPEEYEERKAETDAAVTQAGGESLPLFVMDVVLPMQHMILNIFEPRYRLMIRRVVEGNHRFGMVRIEDSGSLAEVACEVEITECEPLPDGRFHIEVVGKRRFRMTETWEQDGYRVAKVQWLHDTVHPDGSSEKEQLDRSVQTAADLVNGFITRAREIARSDRRLLELLNRTEGMPSVREPERFSFWVANLLHTSSRERLQYLRMTDTHERLSREISRLRAMSTDHNCRIQ
ncbi:hypothetical protein KC19_10G124700 [Ceratodon purpureus]|nr:hypothetical protein KC19_10G124700 [Ceratodon purpureus]